jgi:hypothetical protein
MSPYRKAKNSDPGENRKMKKNIIKKSELG